MSKPIILFAIANDREVPKRYLRGLKQERMKVEDALAGIRNICELKVIPDATIQDLRRFFEDEEYANRIVGFHYAGHANGVGLELESMTTGKNELANAEYLAKYLGNQKSLKFVFLNGCSTEGQVKHFEDAGIPNVIYTKQAINDDAAQRFAYSFYKNLANGKGLADAFKMAEDGLLMEENGNTRSLYWDGMEEEVADLNSPPWKQLIQKDWNFLVRSSGEPLQMFMIYDQADEPHYTQLKKQLSMLRRLKILKAVDAYDMHGGSDMQAEVQKRLEQSQIILLLVSPDYLASDECFELEERAMELYQRGIRVIPVLLRTCDYKELPFARFRPLPRNRKFIMGEGWKNKDEAFYSVAESIKQLCKAMKEE